MNIGLDSKAIEGVTSILCQVLADANVLYIKLRNFHWNLVGARFHTLHLFFEEQYKEVEISIDDVAERIRTLDGIAPGSMAEFLKLTSLKEMRGEPHQGDAFIENLLKDHETIVRELRKSIDACQEKYADTGTADFLTNLLEKHEKAAWMLRSFLQAGEAHRLTSR